VKVDLKVLYSNKRADGILALRVLPILPSNSREAYKDTILPVGGGSDGKSPVLVPAGSMVSFSIMAMQRRKDIWGEDAEEFRPERWEDVKPGINWVMDLSFKGLGHN
jgi:cytochrome P450